MSELSDLDDNDNVNKKNSPPQTKQKTADPVEYTLRKVHYAGRSKWLKVPGEGSYRDVIKAVKESYGLPNGAVLEVADEDKTIIDEDIFDLFPNTGLHITVANVPDTTDNVVFDFLNVVGTGLAVGNSSGIAGEIVDFFPDTTAITDDIFESGRTTPGSSTTVSASAVSIDSGASCSKFTSESSRAFDNLLADLRRVPGGSEIITEYNEINTLSTQARRKLVNIVSNILVDKFGYHPSTEEKTACAKQIITAFPRLKDPGSNEGYELFYDPASRGGYIAWRLRTLNRNKPRDSNQAKKRNKESKEANEDDPSPSPAELPAPEIVADKKSFLQNACSTTQKAEIEEAMRVTLHVRRANPSQILNDYPRFLDTPYMINLEFSLMYPNVEITNFSQSRITHAAETHLSRQSNSTTGSEPDWDATTRAYLTLLKLLPPTAKGRKRSDRACVAAVNDLVITFVKLGTPMEAIEVKGKQPTLVAVGPNKGAISTYFIAVDGNFLPIESGSSAEALDQLFKCHFVLDTEFDKNLSSFYGFLQSFYYGMPEKVTFTPRMREVRCWLSQD